MESKQIEINGREFTVHSDGSVIRNAFTDSRARLFADKPVSPTLHKSGYLYFNVIGKQFYVQRAVACAFLGADLSSHLQVDHINGDKTDNRAVNLRMLTQSENLAAFRKRNPEYSSRYRGVRLTKHGKWSAQFRGGESMSFENEKDAAMHWDKLAFAYGYVNEAMNFPA